MKQIRSTSAKSHIQELLSESTHALSQLELQQQSEGVCDRVTVYRVLDRLILEGVVHKTVGLDGVARYALCKACDADHDHHQHDHVHFSCEKCKEVTCLEKVVPVFKLPAKYKVKEVNFTLSGICPRCN
jgi:Fur family ferric uptake transcriptional regulator